MPVFYFSFQYVMSYPWCYRKWKSQSYQQPRSTDGYRCLLSFISCLSLSHPVSIQVPAILQVISCLMHEATFKKKFEFSWWTDKKVQYSRYVKNYLSILLLGFFKIHFIKTYFQFNFWMTVKHSYFFTYWSKD